jgi:ribosomal protein L7/L12
MNYDIIITIVLFFFFLDNISLRKKINSIDKELEDQKRKSYAGNFYVQLHQIDESKKIEIIMTMRKLTDLSLKEAKNIVDSVRPGIAPIIVSRVNSEYADILKKALEQSECKVTILEKE